MHFMNPVPLMKLVEIVRGLPTSDATNDAVVALAHRFGKTTIGARDIPGFIVNRMLIPLLNEACYGLYEGLGTAADIDTGCKPRPQSPDGAARARGRSDRPSTRGLAIAEVLHARARRRQVSAGAAAPAVPVAAGWLGKKVWPRLLRVRPSGPEEVRMTYPTYDTIKLTVEGPPRDRHDSIANRSATRSRPP